ncbi:class I SAM-dependent methyltransferase [Exiguobacterium flavidum]|uniref:class I SAM-dependent methyltransferase n=1 Tax=Exiguobacterium flavidum TaxID=2184695 RepID=UPI000DF786C3|nr:class I SAM-dependent methyltransferase [Exiguobacterium flavidum]
MAQLKEWTKVLRARRWMKRAEPVLPLWHGYIGYKYGLFDALCGGATQAEAHLRLKQPLTKAALARWFEVGVAVGHLKKKELRYEPTRRVLPQLLKNDERSVGFMLSELMELHLPALFSYPQFLEEGKQRKFDGETHGDLVAETSALVETVAFPPVKHIIRSREIKSLLDIGCAYGGYLRKLHEAMPDLRLAGIDIEESVIEEAKRRDKSGKIDFAVGDIKTFDVDETYDGVMMNNILYYFPEDERIDLLKGVRRFVKDGGTAILVTPLQGSDHGAPFSAAFNTFMTLHENLHPLPGKERLTDDLHRAGFENVSITPFLKEGAWYIVTAEATS